MQEITAFEQIQNGDTLTIKGFYNDKDIHTFHNVTKKETLQDGKEVILQKRNNIYFNFDMYCTGTSWVKKVWKL